MKKLSLDKIIYILVMVVMIGLPLLKFITYIPFIANINPYFIARIRVYFFWISIAFLLVSYLYSVFSGDRKVNYIDYLFYFLIFSLFISTAFAIDFKQSFLGADTRYEGLLTLVNYYLLALNCKNIINEKYKKNIIKCFICIGIFQSFYAILQALTPFTFWNKKFSLGAYMAMGLCSNPNFFGAYMAMQLSIITIYFIRTGKWKYLCIYCLFSCALYLGGSSGPVLGYVLSFVLFGIIFRKNYKRILTLILSFLLVCYCTDKCIKFVHVDLLNSDVSDRYVISSDLAQTVEKIENDKIDSIGSGRIGLWKKCIPLMKEYWLTGAGLDNFGEVYPQSGNRYFDKAHNGYIQIAVTNGIFPLIVYMFICLVVFLKGFKLKKTYSNSLFMAFVSYCILIFANISAIDVAPYFFIILGLLLSDVNDLKIFNKKR